MTVRVLTAAEVRAKAGELGAILADCVAGGASVSFMAPFTADDARAFYERVADAADKGMVSVLVAEVDGVAMGTVQVAYDMPPNQPHRGDIRKLLVYRQARRRGLARALMLAAEEEALARGRPLLVLDTASDGAERLYTELGWQRVGIIPDYALLPDGGYCDTLYFYKRVGPLPDLR
jgi:ribosomal protein S18 acetylase RimI-like enzyme